MKIGILFNRQGGGIANALRAMLPGSEITHFLLPDAATTSALRETTAASLSACDYVVAQNTAADLGPLAADELRRTANNFVTLPNFDFRGFHPDTIRITDGGAELAGPTGFYHSRIAVAGFLAGLTPAETARLYHGLAFARLGYFRAFEQESVGLIERFAQHGLNAVPMMGRLRARGCFMHGIDTPKAAPMMEMARAACALLGLSPIALEPDALPDPLAQQAAHPVFADIAAAIGIEPEGQFRQAAAPGEDFAPLGLQEFVAASLAAFQSATRATLRRASGVVEALAALGLAELSPRNQPVLRERGMALMTWHGTLLRHTSGAEAAHAPLNAPDIDRAMLRIDLPPGDLPDSLDILGGVSVHTAIPDETIALARNAAFLSADRDSARAWFVRDAVGDWECFLPVTGDQLRILRTLLSGAWTPAGASAALPARLTSGPVILFGNSTIGLGGAWPQPLPDDADGTPRLLVMLDGAPAIVRQTTRPPVARDRARIIAMSQRIILTGAEVRMPLPMTLTNAARLWLHESCGEAGGLPWRDQDPRTVIRREADQPMRGPGATPDTGESTLPGPAVVVSDAGAECLHWAAPLLRLLTMAPHLPAGTSVIAPPGAGAGPALSEAWHALGLPPINFVDAPPGQFTARDVIWIDPLAPGRWPAETLLAARAVFLRDARPGKSRVFLRGPAARGLANLSAVEMTLAELDFTILDFAATPPEAQLRALLAAGFIAGASADLAAAAFCPPGTKIIEITPAEAFAPEAWMLSCRLGFTHAVLPCASDESGLQVNRDALSSLVFMLRFRR
jgi:hypothetical protein